jgi:hypothetical protein
VSKRFILAWLPFSLGCYRLIPISPNEPPNGRRISAALSDQASLDLRGRIGPDVRRVEGDVAGVRGDSLELRLRRVEQRSGLSVEWRGEPVTFARRDLSGFAERRIDRRRSWLAAAGVAALGAALTAVIKSGTFGGEERLPTVQPPS